MMTYPEALQYLNSFVNYEKKDSYDYKRSLKLDRMVKLASLLGNPQRDIKSVHVAGTKGKGSTAAIIYSILKSAGYKTGLYTSPHLVSFRERIRINDELISEQDISRLLCVIKKAVDTMDAMERPTFFEVYTAIAYLYFKEKRIDFAVYEVGMGGRCDATNIIDPSISVITPISYEHTDKLGNTLAEIALEKCGIIKEGVACVSATQEPEALGVIKKRCEEQGARLILVGKDITFKELLSDSEREVFDVSGLAGNYHGLESHLLGSYQMVNATTAICAVWALNQQGIRMAPEAIRLGISNVCWPGRLDIVEKDPFIVLDGAQNRASAKALADSIRKIFILQGKCRNCILVLGVSKDKDIAGILEELLSLSDSIILTKSKVVERALEPEKIRERIRGKIGGGRRDEGRLSAEANLAHTHPMAKAEGTRDEGRGTRGSIKDLILTDENVIVTGNVRDALGLARSRASREDLILVTGSLFVVGEAMEILTSTRDERRGTRDERRGTRDEEGTVYVNR